MIKKIINITSTTVFVLLMLIAVLFLFPALPVPGNYQARVVLSGSMEPTIKTGSIVFVRPVNSYQVGDVITFTSRDFRGSKGEIIPVTHRIVEINHGEFGIEFVTKGDANDGKDTRTVRQANILGKAFLVVPYVGYAVETARKPYGFLALILIPATIIMFDQGKNIFSEAKKMKKAKEKNTDFSQSEVES